MPLLFDKLILATCHADKSHEQSSARLRLGERCYFDANGLCSFAVDRYLE